MKSAIKSVNLKSSYKFIWTQVIRYRTTTLWVNNIVRHDDSERLNDHLKPEMHITFDKLLPKIIPNFIYYFRY
jgi:hypothetical protein